MNNKIFKNFLVYLFSDGLTKALPFLIFPLIAYYLTTEEYGVVSNYQVVLSIITPFIGFSLSSYYSVEYHKDELKSPYILGQVLNFYTIAGIFCGVILLIFQGYILEMTQIKSKWLWMAYISAISTAFIGLHLANLRIQEKAKKFGVFSFIKSVALVGLTLLLVVYLRQGAEGRVWSLTISTVSFGLIAIYFVVKFANKFHLPNWSILKSMFFFGLPLLPHTIALWIKAGYEKILITEHIGLSANGVYSFAINLGAILAMVATAFFAAFAPYVYKSLNKTSKDKIHAVKVKIIKQTYLFLIIFLAIAVILLIVSTVGINIFFKDKYEGAINLMPWIFAYHFTNTIYIAFSSYIYFSKKTKFLGIITVMSAIVQILLLNMLIEEYGMMGVVISSLFVSILTVAFTMFYSNKVFYMPWFSKDLLKK